MNDATEHPNWTPQDDTTACPYCGKPNNAWSSTDGAAVERPQAGSLSLCFMCGGLCVYEETDGKLSLRKTTAEEAKAWESDPLVVRTRKIISYTESPNLASSFLLMDQ